MQRTILPRRCLVLLAAALTGMITSVPARAAEAPQADRAGWTTWRNARFGFEICYPTALFPHRRESPQGHGVAVESADSAQLIAATIPYSRATLAEPIRMERERLTHISLMAGEKNWFVVAGTRVDQALYTKAIRANGRLIAFRLRYPQSLAAKYAPIVERIADCLRAA